MPVNEAKRRFLLSALKLFDVGLLVFSFSLATILVASDSYSVSLERVSGDEGQSR